MSLLTGTLSLFRFLALGPWPGEEEVARALEADRFRPFQDGSEDHRHGWVDWRNPLLPVDPATLAADAIATFGLRIDTRRIPAAVLKAHMDQRIETLRNERNLTFISQEARLSIRDEVEAELLPKVMPSMKVVLCQWRFKDGLLLADSHSDVLISAFMKSFGIELQPLCPLLLAGRVVPHINPESLMVLDPMDLRLDEVSA